MNLKLYLVSLVLLLIIDGAWLGFFAKKFYATHLGPLMRTSPAWIPAILFYLLYPAGLTIFVTQPALFLQSWQYALYQGMLLGLIAYATYDLTNHATLRGWKPIVTVVDIVWGTILTGTVAALAVTIAHYWF